MDYRNAIILVTGGSSGIGRAFVERFLREGATDIACGRDEAKLQGLKAQHPSVEIRPCDITSSDEVKSTDSVSHTGIRAARHLGE